MLGMRWSQSMSRRNRYATRRGDNAQCFTGKPARRWWTVVRLAVRNNAVTDIRNLTH